MPDITVSPNGTVRRYESLDADHPTFEESTKEFLTADIYEEALFTMLGLDKAHWEIYLVRPSHVNGDTRERTYGLYVTLKRKE